VSDAIQHLEPADIARLAARRTTAVLWLDGAGAHTWGEFGAAVEAARRQCEAAGVGPGEIVITPGDASPEALAWLFGVALVGGVVAPLRAARAGEIETWKRHCEIGWRVNGGRIEARKEGIATPASARLLAELRARDRPGLLLGTGGTTGRPRLVLHDLGALLASIPVRAGRPARIMPLMKFDHIGGLDIAWRALASGQTLVAPPKEITPEAVAEKIAEAGVEVLPATPSFLNLLLLSGAARSHELRSLRTVPYGAEPMPAGLLTRLRAALPGVDFRERFGTSETGALPVRAEGEGLVLPEAFSGFAWKIVEGELWVLSPARALGYLTGEAGGFAEGGWFCTGDLAERREDGAIRVLGRRSDLINVGGEKVLPSVVETVLMGHPLVADCRVFAAANAVLGQVVAAEIVWRGPERDAVAVKRALHAWATALPNCHLPAVVRLADAIYISGNLKKVRTIT